MTIMCRYTTCQDWKPASQEYLIYAWGTDVPEEIAKCFHHLNKRVLRKLGMYWSIRK